MKRKKTGSSVIELAMCSAVIAVITVVCVDLAIVVFGTSVHDRACREATRAASKGSTKTTAIALAQAALAAGQTDGSYVSQPSFTDSDMTFNDFGGSPKPDELPTVTLTTHSQIKLPADINFFTASLGVQNGKFDSAVKYVFPLTNIQVPIPSEAP